VFTVRIQLPEGIDNDLGNALLSDRFVALLKAAAVQGGGAAKTEYGPLHKGLRMCPEGTVVHVADALTGETLFQHGAFRQPPPDAESAAEEKGDAEREGDR
jgi:hypothetical protein